jgi:uncharacterized caspase-like protein
MQRAATDVYRSVSITYALDEDASRNNLERAIAKLSREIHPRDTFILFAAAHGTSVGGRYYLIPQDHQGGANPHALMKRAVGQDQLQDWLANRIKAKRAIILLDTCESGALIAGFARSRTEEGAETSVGRLHEAIGRPVLTAAAQGQFAYEDTARTGVRHGLFTWALLDALRNGDTDRSGTIELLELVSHVQGLVPQLAARLGGVGRATTGFVGVTSGSEKAEVFEQTARFGSRGENFTLTRRAE